MPRIIILCSKNRDFLNKLNENVIKLNKRLSPDNIEPNPSKMNSNGNINLLIFNPSDYTKIHDTSAVLGNILNDNKDWWNVGNSVPDGAFSLFRSDENSIELITDNVGSRTIWYYFDDDIFIGSNSQRAIVHFIRSFELNDQAIYWMLSSGTLGPFNSWDNRIKMIRPNSRVVFNKVDWEIKVLNNPTRFKEIKRKNRKNYSIIKSKIMDTFSNIDLNPQNDIFLLSGGYDSRGSISFLKDRDKYKYISWGKKKSLENKLSDIYIAKKFAQKNGLEHSIFYLDVQKEENFDNILLRYLLNGEGRTDNIAGYLDGFLTWKWIFESGFSRVIRSDEGFGWLPVQDIMYVKKLIGYTTISDYSNLLDLKSLGFNSIQKLDPLLEKSDCESISQWRDRLYHQFRLPIVHSSLNFLKSAYVDICNPLLSSKILNEVRNLPDSLRTDKKIWKKILKGSNSGIKYAKDSSIFSLNDFLKSQYIAKFLIKKIENDKLLPLELKTFILDLLNKKEEKISHKKLFYKIKEYIGKILPPKLYFILSNKKAYNETPLNKYKLAFRMVIVCQMNKILSEDAIF